MCFFISVNLKFWCFETQSPLHYTKSQYVTFKANLCWTKRHNYIFINKPVCIYSLCDSDVTHKKPRLLIHRTRKQMGGDYRNQWGESLRSILRLHSWLPFSLVSHFLQLLWRHPPPLHCTHMHTHSHTHTSPNSFRVTKTKHVTAWKEKSTFLKNVISSISPRH